MWWKCVVKKKETEKKVMTSTYILTNEVDFLVYSVEVIL